MKLYNDYQTDKVSIVMFAGDDLWIDVPIEHSSVVQVRIMLSDPAGLSTESLRIDCSQADMLARMLYESFSGRQKLKLLRDKVFSLDVTYQGADEAYSYFGSTAGSVGVDEDHWGLLGTGETSVADKVFKLI